MIFPHEDKSYQEDPLTLQSVFEEDESSYSY